MNIDRVRDDWNTQATQTSVTIEADRLLEEVQRKQRLFTAIIFWRDVREVGVALVLVPVWIYLGIRFSHPWTWYLTVPALLWVAGFMLLDRIAHKRQPAEMGASVREGLATSLAQVEHQIWLLRNVVWWYLAPIAFSMLAYFAQVSWKERSGGWGISVAFVLVVALGAAVLGVIYWVNREAVRSYLEPRRQEIAVLLASLKEEIPSEGSRTEESSS